MSCLFVEQLTVIDCAYLDDRRGLVGESWIVDLELEGELDGQGMVLDFGEVKKKLRRVIDDAADHRLLVPGRSPRLHFVRSGDRTGLTFRAECGVIEHQAPAMAVCLLEAESVTTASLTGHLHAALLKAVPENVYGVRLLLRHEVIDGAWYHYTHGLKKHAGHCQRIAHGHRSRLEIRVDGRRDPKLEQHWAERWRDIYLGTSSDVAAHTQGRLRFVYRAGEGEFELELPAERCELLTTDSTVEHIAEYIAQQVATGRPASKIEVRAYEGVMKGALATAG
jgi:6-pyruvoyl-tetrahydropterin synthase